ncbi:MAG: 3-deoxy-D-manno-octulosonic acid transferase [Armatimonadetes bacterium]|nr:3-deoxy-D-manno-octulosonic acid transferase [Armatimonadota bacterium]
MIWIYNFLLTLASPFWVPWMIWRARRRKEGVDWKERGGDYPFRLAKGTPRLWMHAVSVGEVMAALPILRAVRAKDPSLEIVLSVTTSSGHKTAQDAGEGLFDHLVYYPIDVYRFVLAGLARVRPTVVAVMETELWMNFLDAAKNIGATTMLVNGRISDRSFPRARLFRFFYRSLLTRIDRCLMQSETDRERILALGAKEAEVFGNCKFDQAAEGLDADPEHWRSELGLSNDRPVVVIGSTRSEMEEDFVLQAIRGLDAQVVWAPRHLERTGAIKSLLEGAGVSVRLRSQGSAPPSQVVLLDTYGELSQVYSVADIVVIGGGFDDLGGQNLIQPLAHGKPVIHGPNMQNFKDVTEAADRAGAARCVRTPSELRTALETLLADKALRVRMGGLATDLVKVNLGASERYAEAIVRASGHQSKGPELTPTSTTPAHPAKR